MNNKQNLKGNPDLEVNLIMALVHISESFSSNILPSLISSNSYWKGTTANLEIFKTLPFRISGWQQGKVP